MGQMGPVSPTGRLRRLLSSNGCKYKSGYSFIEKFGRTTVLC